MLGPISLERVGLNLKAAGLIDMGCSQIAQVIHGRRPDPVLAAPILKVVQQDVETLVPRASRLEVAKELRGVEEYAACQVTADSKPQGV
jgi:hypothetical protein